MHARRDYLGQGGVGRHQHSLGSFASSTNPVLRDMHEYIMVFSKDQFKLPDGGKTGIQLEASCRFWTRSIWRPEVSPDDKSPK